MVPFFTIQIKHLDAVATGAAFLLCIAVMFIFASRTGWMSTRFGERPFLIIGIIASATGIGLCAIFARQSGYAACLLPGMIGLGVMASDARMLQQRAVLNLSPVGGDPGQTSDDEGLQLGI